MLYKLPKRKPTMSEGDRLIIAFMVLFFIPFIVCLLIEVML
jgi:hypothetical protein